VDSEPHKKNSFIIRPGEKMQLAIKGLEEDGLTCSCDRNTALSNEDMQFLRWTHPLVTDVMDQILSSEMGNTAIATVSSSNLSVSLQPGTLLLESIFIFESKAANIQQMFTVVVDINGSEITQATVDFQAFPANLFENVDKETIPAIIETYKPEIKSMLKSAELKAQENSEVIINKLFKLKLSRLNEEKDRLVDLQKVNPAVRNDEIDFFAQQIDLLEDNKKHTGIRLDAIRLLVVT